MVDLEPGDEVYLKSTRAFGVVIGEKYWMTTANTEGFRYNVEMDGGLVTTLWDFELIYTGNHYETNFWR